VLPRFEGRRVFWAIDEEKKAFSLSAFILPVNTNFFNLLSIED
jgi:hypothetical protein